jgi:hypothetical protein
MGYKTLLGRVHTKGRGSGIFHPLLYCTLYNVHFIRLPIPLWGRVHTWGRGLEIFLSSAIQYSMWGCCEVRNFPSSAILYSDAAYTSMGTYHISSHMGSWVRNFPSSAIKYSMWGCLYLCVEEFTHRVVGQEFSILCYTVHCTLCGAAYTSVWKSSHIGSWVRNFPSSALLYTVHYVRLLIPLGGRVHT